MRNSSSSRCFLESGLICVSVRPSGFDFLHAKMRICRGGDLRKVGDAEDLAVFPELPEFLADDRGGLPSDVCVDLIEDQCRRIVLFCERDLDRKEEAGEFSAAGVLFDKAGVLSGVGLQPELHGVIAGMRCGAGERSRW